MKSLLLLAVCIAYLFCVQQQTGIPYIQFFLVFLIGFEVATEREISEFIELINSD